MEDLLYIYDKETTSEYRGELFRVRDNGSVFRCKRLDKRKRPLDEIWTFGNPNKNSGYMNIGSETVHRIIATAFHGSQPSEKHIVDHIDTNRRNNRPENLRWVTRLENILLNPITLRRIIINYGSIEDFLENPSIPIRGSNNLNFDWMGAVTKEESANTLKNLIKWTESGKIPKGGELEHWIFTRQRGAKKKKSEDIFTQSLTANVLQVNWKTPCEFPNCPQIINEGSLINYGIALIEGGIFSRNQFGETFVLKKGLNKKSENLVVMTKRENVKPFGLVKIYLNADLVIHESLGSFFKEDGAEKQFTLALGLEWSGGETFDESIS